jgi:hypothetical protein
MDIKTDNSAVIATLNKRIENLERYNAGLANESCEQQIKIAELEKERDISNVEQRSNTLWFALENITNPEIIYNSRKRVLKEIQALKEQDNG